jgi:hypothetical protein
MDDIVIVGGFVPVLLVEIFSARRPVSTVPISSILTSARRISTSDLQSQLSRRGDTKRLPSGFDDWASCRTTTKLGTRRRTDGVTRHTSD